MFKFLSATLLSISLSTAAFAYDATKAKESEKFFSHMTQKACTDSKLFIDAKKVMEKIREGDNYLLLDVRTKGEASVVSISDKNSVHIELMHLFEKKNLDTLPTDKPIIIVCHSGSRATMAAITLKQIGFKNVHILKGGLVALSEADTTKNAPLR